MTRQIYSKRQKKRDIKQSLRKNTRQMTLTIHHTVYQKRLKSPLPLNFPIPNMHGYSYLKTAQHKIYGYVDSQNSYGAMLRVNWYVKLILNGQEWRLLDMKIYER